MRWIPRHRNKKPREPRHNTSSAAIGSVPDAGDNERETISFMKKTAVILVISFLMTFTALPYGLLADSGAALTISYAYSDVGFNVYRVAEEVNGN